MRLSTVFLVLSLVLLGNFVFAAWAAYTYPNERMAIIPGVFSLFMSGAAWCDACHARESELKP